MHALKKLFVSEMENDAGNLIYMLVFTIFPIQT